MNTTREAKWASTAGPRQTKEVDKALRALSWRGRTRAEITDSGRFEMTNVFGPVSEDASKATQAIGEKYDFLITRENYKAIVADLQSATSALVIPEDDKRTTPEEREERARKLQTMQEEREAKRHAKDKAISEHVKALREKCPWAIGPDRFKTEAARVAANIKKELSLAFPGQSFRVTSDTFSMGDSVDIRWDMGPTDREVSEITGKYQQGSFDGMQDMYVDDTSAESEAVSIVLGQAKYVQTSRDIPVDMLDTIGRMLCDRQNVVWQGLSTRNLYGEGDYNRNVGEHARILLYETSFYGKGPVKGLIDNDSGIQPYAIEFETMAKAPTSPEVSAVSSGATVEKHFHTKQQIDFWLVIPAVRLSREDFEALRDRCKDAGGWYSRKWGKCPGGFAFDNEPAAQSFASTL